MSRGGSISRGIYFTLYLSSNNIDYFAMQYVKLKEGFITFTPKKNILCSKTCSKTFSWYA